MNNFPRIVIAGIRGGSGKTTLSLAVIAALSTEKELKIIPFKKGPDYIDAGWMSAAAKNPCYNLDPFLITGEKILDSFISHFTGDVAIIEGNRGLYDGMDAEGSYSTAELAKLLKAPVILIVDCTKMTKTTAAIVLGCMNMDKDVQIKGIVLNQVSGERHESVIRQSIERYCSLPVLGAIPRLESEEFPERHMGLTPYQEHPAIEKALLFVEEIAKKYLDIDGIIKTAMEAEPLTSGTSHRLQVTSLKEASSIQRPSSVKIGIIKDSAFQFYYPENLDELRSHGANIIEISALKEKELPDMDALYIGGGFPETHAIALAENTGFLSSLKKAITGGLPVYAECGGLMYLGEGLLLENKIYPMAGIFPLVFSLEKKPQAHGYSVVEVIRKNPFYDEGTILRGHEFHYSKPVNASKDLNDFYYAFKMKRGVGIYEGMDGICHKNTFATYTHLHAYGAKEWIEGVLRRAMEFKRQKNFASMENT